MPSDGTPQSFAISEDGHASSGSRQQHKGCLGGVAPAHALVGGIVIGALVTVVCFVIASAVRANAASAPAGTSNKVKEPVLYDPKTSEITGYLIDLDGTMYRPGGLIPGAKEFYTFLKKGKHPYVFLSNTGSKTKDATQAKFASADYKLDDEKVPLDNIWTAAEAQMDMMVDPVDGLPKNAYLFVISDFSPTAGGWLDLLKQRNEALVNTWTIVTRLSSEDAQKWACESASGKIKVYVVLFFDGKIGKDDPLATKEHQSGTYQNDWNFVLLTQVSAILAGGGGTLVYTADDASNPSLNPNVCNITFPLPGPGMFGALLQKVMYPFASNTVLCAGKGGGFGKKFMMEKGIELLKKQGHDGDRSKIAMIGDRFDTDIRGGVSAGLKSILVESGVHRHSMQKDFAEEPATWYAPSVGSLVKQSACSLAEA